MSKVLKEFIEDFPEPPDRHILADRIVFSIFFGVVLLVVWLQVGF